jgi:hypothetical protein
MKVKDIAINEIDCQAPTLFYYSTRKCLKNGIGIFSGFTLLVFLLVVVAGDYKNGTANYQLNTKLLAAGVVLYGLFIVYKLRELFYTGAVIKLSNEGITVSDLWRKKEHFYDWKRIQSEKVIRNIGPGTAITGYRCEFQFIHPDKKYMPVQKNISSINIDANDFNELVYRYKLAWYTRMNKQ